MGNEALDEDGLLIKIAGGDMRALEALYRLMRVRVFPVALAVVCDPDAAEDVMQDTFVRVYSAAPRYRPESRARAWVLTIARHLALDAVRRRSPEPVSAMTDFDAAAPVSGLDGIRLDAAELRVPAGTVRWRYRIALPGGG